MHDLNTEPKWKGWEKIGFRFLFLFLGFYLLNYEVVFIFLALNQFDKLSTVYTFFEKPVLWIDKQLLHIGYNPTIHQNLPGDNHYGVAFYFTAFILFLFITATWSILDKRKPNYSKLYFWFRVYIRYMVALVMLEYGIDKLIPIQMTYPDVTELLKPLGKQDHFGILWDFVGASPGYEIFTGLCEVTGSLLLIFRRTYVFGALFMCTVLCNVVALNVFYNISVKLYSALLLTCVLFLLIPFANKLYQFFFNNRNVSLTEKQFGFETAWKRHILTALAITVVVGTIAVNFFHDYNIYRERITERKRQKLYDVAWFIAKDTLAPLLTDTLRWKKFALVYKNSAVVYNMKDSAVFYDYDLDSVKHLFTLHDNPDSTKWDKLYFAYPTGKRLALTGKWKGIEVQMMMDEIPIDSMPFNKEKLIFIQE